MDPMRSMQADVQRIRDAFRRVRGVLQDGHDRLEMDMASRMPDPAAGLALHVLQNVRVVAGGIDGILSGVAHRAFPDERAERGRARMFHPVARMNHLPVSSPLAMAAGRLGSDSASPRLAEAARALGADRAGGGVLEPQQAADLYMRLTEEGMQADICLAVFAALLTELSPPDRSASRETMANSAADLCSALREDILAASASRDSRQVAALLAKYAAHV